MRAVSHYEAIMKEFDAASYVGVPAFYLASDLAEQSSELAHYVRIMKQFGPTFCVAAAFRLRKGRMPS